MWTLAFGHHEDRTLTHGYEPAVRDRDGGIREELAAGMSILMISTDATRQVAPTR
jgi:hypothetical protein